MKNQYKNFIKDRENILRKLRFKYLTYKRTSEFRLQILKAASLCVIYVASFSQMTNKTEEQRRCTLFANNHASYYQIRYGRGTIMWFKLLMARANFDTRSNKKFFWILKIERNFIFNSISFFSLTSIWLYFQEIYPW